MVTAITTTLGTLGATYSGLSGKTGRDFGHGVGRYVPFSNVMRAPLVDLGWLERVEVSPSEQQNEVAAGDVLFNGSSETPEEVGFGSFVEAHEGTLFLNSFCFGYRIRRADLLDGRFLAHWSRSQAGRRFFQPLAQGSTRYNLSKRAMLQAPIAFPSVEKQRVAAAILDDCDRLVASTSRLLDKKRDLRNGALVELLGVDRRLPGYDDEWRTVPFAEVLQRVSTRNNQVTTRDYRRFGPLPVVDQGRDLIVAYSDRLDRQFTPPAGGAVLFGDHTCVVKLVDFPCAIGAEGTQLLLARPGIVARFVYYELLARPIRSTGYNRHFKFLLDREFRIPNAEEQQAIADVLDDMDTEITQLGARLRKTRALRAAVAEALLSKQDAA